MTASSAFKLFLGFSLAKPKGLLHVQAKPVNPAIQELRELANTIASQVTAMHPLVPKLADPAAQAEVFKALFELTKQVEVVKKHLLKLERRDDSALL
jgi:hypothetical protein